MNVPGQGGPSWVGFFIEGEQPDTGMANPECQTIIDRNRALARELGINGTSGFLVGTELVPQVLDLKDSN